MTTNGTNEEKGMLLRVFIEEKEKTHGQPAYEWIVRQARERGLAGAAVVRGILGYGGDKVLHSAKLLEISDDLPMIVEIMDTGENLRKFIVEIGAEIKSGYAALEEVRIFRFGK
jgi:PII-like signaling protein